MDDAVLLFNRIRHVTSRPGACTPPILIANKLDSSGVEPVPAPIPIRSVTTGRWWDSARRLAVYPVVIVWVRECCLFAPFHPIFYRLNK